MIELEHFVIVWPHNDETRELPPEALELRVKGFPSIREAMRFQGAVADFIRSYATEAPPGGQEYFIHARMEEPLREVET